MSRRASRVTLPAFVAPRAVPLVALGLAVTCAIALGAAAVSSQVLYVAGGASNCGSGACTAVYRYDGGTTTPVYVLPASLGEIVALTADGAGHWSALARTPAGSAALVRDGMPVAFLPGAPVDVAAADDGTVYVATQELVPVMQPATVHAWENGVLTPVFTQPLPADALIALDVDVDEDIHTVTQFQRTHPQTRFFEDGVLYGGFQTLVLTSFTLGQDGVAHYSADPTASATHGGTVEWQSELGSNTLYTQPAALGTIDAAWVPATKTVFVIAADPGGAGPLRLIEDGVVIATFAGLDRGIDLAAPAFHYPDAWVDLGGGSPGTIGVPRLQGYGVLAPGTPGELVVDHVVGFAQGLMFLAATPQPLPWLQGTLYAQPALVELPAFSDFDGYWSVPWFALPAGLQGAQLVIQIAYLDPNVPAGISLTNALVATFAP